MSRSLTVIHSYHLDNIHLSCKFEDSCSILTVDNDTNTNTTAKNSAYLPSSLGRGDIKLTGSHQVDPASVFAGSKSL